MLMRRFLLLLLFLYMSILATMSQEQKYILQGYVLSSDNQPIPYASIYVRERLMGTATNQDGFYRLELPAGKNIVVFQAVGFSVAEIPFSVSVNVEQNVILQTQQYGLAEVTVNQGDEDPAIPIMRKAIAMAPLHLHAVKSYNARMYIRGSLRVDKVPALLRPTLSGVDLHVGDTYTIESLGDIEFTSPNKYVHNIISEQNSLATLNISNDNARITYLNRNMYDAKSTDFDISPLSAKALSYYKFVYEGYSMLSGQIVNHIKVIPKHKSKQLYSGVIHVVDNSWALSYIDLSIETFAGSLRFRQTYSPVGEDCWLPVTQNYILQLSMLGVQGDVKYIGSLKYNDIDIADISKQREKVLAIGQGKMSDIHLVRGSEARNRRVSRRLGDLLQKQDLSDRDMVKTVRLVEKQYNMSDSSSRSLEVFPFRKYSFNFNQSVEADSTEWKKQRAVPLDNAERYGFLRSDSVALGLKSVQGRQNASGGEVKKWYALLIGNSDHKIGDSIVFKYSGLISPGLIYFHPVTGFVVGQSFSFTKMLPIGSISVGSTVMYDFSPKKSNGDIYVRWANEKALVRVSVGSVDADWKEPVGDLAFTNSFANLFSKRNHRKLVQKNYMRLDFQTQPIWGMNVDFSVASETLMPLENRTNFSIFKRHSNYDSNVPENKYLSDEYLAEAEQTYLSLAMKYTPKLRYRIGRNGKRIALDSRVPTIKIGASHGIGGALHGESSFSHFWIGLEQKHAFTLTKSFSWNVEAGSFFNASSLPFAYWKHFAGTNKVFGITDMRSGYTGFVSFKPYRMSTNDWYVNTSAFFQMQRLMLKQLPLFSNRMWTEELYLKQAIVAGKDAYTEFGYGVGQILLVARVSCFVSFHNLEFETVNLRLGLAIGDFINSVRN